MTNSSSNVVERPQAFEIEVSNSVDPMDREMSARQRAAATPYTPDYERPPARRPSSEREESFSALGWLLDGATGLIGEIRHNDLGLSEEFWVHAYAAERRDTGPASCAQQHPVECGVRRETGKRTPDPARTPRQHRHQLLVRFFANGKKRSTKIHKRSRIYTKVPIDSCKFVTLCGSKVLPNLAYSHSRVAPPAR